MIKGVLRDYAIRLGIIFVFVIIYIYFLADFIGKTLWVFIPVLLYLMYFVINDLYIKRRELELCLIDKN